MRILPTAFLVSFALGFGLNAAAWGAQGTKEPPPDAAAQKSAEKVVRDVFKEEYGKKAPADRLALAKKLLDQARGTKDDPATLYVLLRDAKDMAVQGGDPLIACKAIDELAAHFVIEASSMKLTILATASKGAKTPEDFAALSRTYLKLSDDAAESADYELAGKALEQASASARKGKDVALISRIDSRLKKISGIREKSERAKKATETLLQNPDDPAANTVLGQFECFVRGRWEAGLPLLAKGSDASQKALALRDLAGPSEPADQTLAGDGWWDLAEQERGVERERIRDRSLFWYEKAVKKLAGGLQKVKIEKRMSSIQAERAAEGPWVTLSDPTLFDLPGSPGDPIVLDKKGATLKNLPAGTFDGISVRISAMSSAVAPNIQHAPLKEMVCLDVDDKSIALQHYTSAGGWKVGLKAPLPAASEYVVTLLLEEGKIIVTVNGAELIRVRSDTDRILPLRLANPTGRATYSELRIRRKE